MGHMGVTLMYNIYRIILDIFIRNIYIYTVPIFRTCSRIDSWSNLRESLFDLYFLVLVLGALR